MPNEQELYKYLETAEKAARQAGAVLRSKFGTSLHIDKKGRINLVTEADLASEELIRSVILSQFPAHEFLGEESGLSARTGQPRWIVDPLDGTTNFAQGYPFFSVSIALEINNEIAIGVVYDPTHDELFCAAKGQGAQLNGRPIKVSNHSVLEEALLVTGFPYEIRRDPDILLAVFKELIVRARGIRRDGSAALDLCYVACGRFDSFWEIGLHPWDIAAGSLLIAEAGGRVTNFSDQPHNLLYPEMLASNSLLHGSILEAIRPHLDRLHASALLARPL